MKTTLTACLVTAQVLLAGSALAARPGDPVRSGPLEPDGPAILLASDDDGLLHILFGGRDHRWTDRVDDDDDDDDDRWGGRDHDDDHDDRWGGRDNDDNDDDGDDGDDD